MKWKRIVCLLMLFALFPAAGHAQTLDEWNRSCRRKMSQTTTVYSGADPTRAIDTIQAGTYVQVGSRTDLRSYITYMKSDGVLRSGFVATGTVGSAVISFTDANGDRQGMQELEYYDLYGNGTPPGAKMDPVYTGHTDYSTFDPYQKNPTEDAAPGAAETSSPAAPQPTAPAQSKTQSWSGTLEEWNRSCRNKTICETEVYSDGDVTRLKTTIPANTYVKVHSITTWAHISYRTATGQSGYGLVKPECIGAAVIFFTDADGDRRGIQELQYYEMYGHNPPPGGVLDKPLPGGNGETVGKPASSGRDETTDQTSASSSTSTGKTSSTAKPTTKTAKKTASTDAQASAVVWTGKQVDVVRLGTQTSIVRHEGEEIEVPTAELKFPGNVSSDKRIASIYAPKTGKCSLREKASDKGELIQKCKAGRLVVVLEYRWKWSKILCEGQTGYVLTACLEFHPADEAPIGQGVLHYNGKTTGRRVFAIRNAADSQSAVVGDWRIGAQVLVFAKKGVWYEIEADGQRGWVRDKYLKMDENE